MIRRGVTLLEMIVVVSLLASLVGLALPAVQSARDSAARASCQNNLRQVGHALHNHHSAFGRLPPHGGGDGLGVTKTRSPDILLSWMAHVLPYVEQDSLWDVSVAACRVDPHPYANPPHTGYSTVIRTYVCPADSRLLSPLMTPRGGVVAFTSYIGSSGSFGSGALSLPGGRIQAAPGALGEAPGATFQAFTDGTSQTIMVGERPPPDTLQAGGWYQRFYNLERYGGPNAELYYLSGSVVASDPCAVGEYGPGVLKNPCDRSHFWSLHRGGSNFVFADGSVRFLGYSARSVMSALVTRSAGEVVEIP